MREEAENDEQEQADQQSPDNGSSGHKQINIIPPAENDQISIWSLTE